jgi:hypothetical protein
MPKSWPEMTVEEQLDDLHGTVQRLCDIMNESANRGNREFTMINRCLSYLERVVESLGSAARGLLDRADRAA